MSPYRFLFQNLLIIIGLVFSNSCTFNNEGDFFNDIEINEEDLPHFYLNTHGDIITIYEPTELRFILGNDKYKEGFFDYSVRINGKSIDHEVFDNKEIRLRINPLDFEIKLLTLSIESSLRSGTGSLADKLEAEYYTFKQEWKIIIDFSLPEKISPLVSIKDGKVVVEWEKREDESINSYILKAIYEDVKGNIHFDFESYDNYEDLIYYDETFNGIQKRYIVDIVSDWYRVAGDTVSLSLEPIQNVNFSIRDDYFLKLTWDSIPFHNLSNTLKVSFKDKEYEVENLSIDSIEIYHEDLLSDSVITVTFILESSDKYVPPYTKEYTFAFKPRLKLDPGFKFSSINSVFYYFENEILIIVENINRNTIIHEIDPESFIIQNSIEKYIPDPTYHPSQSNVLFSASGLSSNQIRTYRIDLQNNYDYSEFDLNKLYGDCVSCGGSVLLGSPEKISMKAFARYETGYDYTLIYNLLSDEIEFIDSVQHNIHLSSIDNYALNLNSQKLMVFDNGVWNQFADVPIIFESYPSLFWFKDGSMMRLVVFQINKVNILSWNVNDNSPTIINDQKFLDNPLYDFYFDPLSNLYGAKRNISYTQALNVVFDINDLEIKHQLKFSSNVQVKFVKDRFLIANGYIFIPN